MKTTDITTTLPTPSVESDIFSPENDQIHANVLLTNT